MYAQFRFLLLVFISCLLIPGCGKQQEAKPDKKTVKKKVVTVAEPIVADNIVLKKDYAATKNAVTVKVKKVSEAESTELFGYDLSSYGYQPLKLAITNESAGEMLLRGSAITLPLAKVSRVARSAQFNAAIWAMVPATYLSILFFWPALIPSIGAMFWMEHKNKKVANAVKNQAFTQKDMVMILPHERFEKIFFVKADQLDETEDFIVNLYDMSKKSFVPFKVPVVV